MSLLLKNAFTIVTLEQFCWDSPNEEWQDGGRTGTVAYQILTTIKKRGQAIDITTAYKVIKTALEYTENTLEELKQENTDKIYNAVLDYFLVNCTSLVWKRFDDISNYIP